jgi:2-polyprenyl-6-methoxyphenol hydroxylase-like FAD-dependent oxidoreductase
MARADRILIVGGGIAGLTLAVALRSRGIDAELVERRDAWPAIGAGINLPANGVRVLDLLGLGDALRRASEPVARWTFVDSQGAPLCEVRMDDIWREVGPCLAITRVRLQEALLGGAGMPHRLGVALTAITDKGDKARVEFSDGACGDYDLVVGADGIYSTVRRLVFSSAPPRYAGLSMWRSLIDNRLSEIDGLTLFMGEGRIFGLLPMGGQEMYGFGAMMGAPIEDPMAGRLERFHRSYADFGAPVRKYLDALRRDEDLHFGPIEYVEIDAWRRGHVVLIGDAAHAGPPHMAEGGCMAMEDAFVLAETLNRFEDIEAVLDALVERRRSRAQWVQSQSLAAAKAWSLPPTIRDALLRERGVALFLERYRPLIAPP